MMSAFVPHRLLALYAQTYAPSTNRRLSSLPEIETPAAAALSKPTPLPEASFGVFTDAPFHRCVYIIRATDATFWQNIAEL
jgi:hypothetical protein